MNAGVPAGNIRIIDPDSARGIAPDDVLALLQNVPAFSGDKPATRQSVALCCLLIDVVCGSAKRVSHAMNGADPVRVLSVVGKGSSYFADKDIQIRLQHVTIGPDPLEQFVLDDHAGTPGKQETKQVKRFRRKVKLPSV